MSGDWLRVAHSQINPDAVAIQLGNIIEKYDGKIEASGDLKMRLETQLTKHMEKENKTEYPYNYWGKSVEEDDRRQIGNTLIYSTKIISATP